MSAKGSVKGEAVQIKNLQSVASESLNRHGSLKQKEKIMKTEPIHRTSMWKFKLSAATMTLIPAAVGINYVAKALAEG